MFLAFRTFISHLFGQTQIVGTQCLFKNLILHDNHPFDELRPDLAF